MVYLDVLNFGSNIQGLGSCSSYQWGDVLHGYRKLSGVYQRGEGLADIGAFVVFFQFFVVDFGLDEQGLLFGVKAQGCGTSKMDIHGIGFEPYLMFGDLGDELEMPSFEMQGVMELAVVELELVNGQNGKRTLKSLRGGVNL